MRKAAIIGRMNSIKNDINKYKSGLGYLNSATSEINSNISSLKRCVSLLTENFLINSNTGDSGLTQESIDSLNSLNEKIGSAISAINSRISELQNEYNRLSGQLASAEDDED